MMQGALKFFFLFCIFFALAGASAYLTLTLVIESEETVVVPDLRGRHAITVLERLSDLGLNTRVKDSEYSEDTPLHHVVYQEPAPGNIIKKGREVRIVLSKGSRILAVPNLSGLSLQQAEVILANNGLKQGVITKVYSRNAEKSAVIDHTPAAGTEVKKEDKVDILVSMGPRPETIFMPELKGLALEKALGQLDSLGLNIGRVDSVHRSRMQNNIIVEQKPRSGYYVRQNQAVNLTVNRPDMEAGADIRESERVLFRYQVPAGILKQHIRIELEAFGSTSMVYDQLMKPGREIWLLVPMYTDAAVFLYKNDSLVKTEVYR